MRDTFMEAALSARLRNNSLGPSGHHGRGWSWVGGCTGAYCLTQLYPEINENQPKGAMFPGTGAHWFFQEFVFPAGSMFMQYEVLGHEQEVFITVKHKIFRMSPIDTLFWDTDENSFWIVDYKSAKDLTWTEDHAKIENQTQINLYAYALSKQNPTLKVGGYLVIYIDKQNYDNFQIHRYEMDLDLAKHAIERLELADNWIYDEEFRETVPWTYLASGLNKLTTSKQPYRYVCEPSARTPSYKGCPYKDICLKLLSQEYGEDFTSFIRYDQFLLKGD